VIAGSDVHAGLVAGDTVYVLEHGRVVVQQAATERFREAMRHGNSSATLHGLVQPIPASAACPLCAGAMGACVLAIAACSTGCGGCCTLAGALCLFALNCCFNQ
jgi:hypothetical protein